MSRATTIKPAGGGGTGRDPIEPGYGDYGFGGGASRRMRSAQLGLWIALGSIAVLFGTFTSAYVSRSAAEDWVPLQTPPLLFLNTLVLMASSATIEVARRRFNSWRPLGFRKWMLLTTVLGVTFLAGQFVVWQELAGRSIHVASNPRSSFFYLLTGLHAAHLLVGLLVLVGVLLYRCRLIPGQSSSPLLAATYWHFMDGVWLWLLLLLVFM